MKYRGRDAPELKDLCVAVINRLKSKKFNLADKLRCYWNAIGMTLGIDSGVLDSFRVDNFEESRRLEAVFRHWIENADGLRCPADYPLSWTGLHTLLDDIGMSEVAKQYFDFLAELSES